MTGSSILLAFLLVAFVEFVAGAALVKGAGSAAPLRRLGVAAAVSAPAAFVALFFSLAVHMKQSLGGWPERIGTAGFPPALLVHDALAGYAFTALILGSIGAWPLAVLLCAAVPRWRPGLRYLGIAALAAGAALVAIWLAPAPFLEWWWD